MIELERQRNVIKELANRNVKLAEENRQLGYDVDKLIRWAVSEGFDPSIILGRELHE